MYSCRSLTQSLAAAANTLARLMVLRPMWQQAAEAALPNGWEGWLLASVEAAVLWPSIQAQTLVKSSREADGFLLQAWSEALDAAQSFVAARASWPHVVVAVWNWAASAVSSRSAAARHTAIMLWRCVVTAAPPSVQSEMINTALQMVRHVRALDPLDEGARRLDLRPGRWRPRRAVGAALLAD
jgi:hypothetical protein